MRRLSTLTMIAALAASLAACGSGSSGGSGEPAGQPTAGAAAEQAVTTLYETFFSAPTDQAKTLVEDGDTLEKAFKVALKLKGDVTESAKVKKVTITGPTTADVLFELDGDGKPLIPESSGKAVYVDGQWLVAKATFCGLVLLGDPNTPGCV